MNRIILAFCLLGSILFSCKKETAKNEPPLTKTELLAGKTFKKWKVTRYQTAYPISNPTILDNAPNELNTIAATYRDNTVSFYPDGAESINEGLTGVNAGQDYYTGLWKFSDNETKLDCMMLFGLNKTRDEKYIFKLKELTNSKLVIVYEEVFPTGNVLNIQWTLEPTN